MTAFEVAHGRIVDIRVVRSPDKLRPWTDRPGPRLAAVGNLAERAGKLVQRDGVPVVLELDLTEGVVDAAPGDPVSAALSYRRPRLQHVLEGLRWAKSDPDVAALVVKVGGSRLSLAAAQEVRGALAEFRRAGKLTVAWAETFGESGTAGNVAYVLATGCEKIYLQPSGDLGLTGIGIEEPFVRDVLDKVGVEPELGQRHEYKTAANTLVERGYTDAHRRMSQDLVESLTRQLVAAVADGRGLTEQQVRDLISRAPLLASEALDAGLVDSLAYRDEVYDGVRDRVGRNARCQYVTRYHRSLGNGVSRWVAGQRRSATIALIHATGTIRLGRSVSNPLGTAVGSETVGAAFRAAVNDDRVRAIVFRVDSPGGSYVASDAIWRHVVLARRRGKPVVVSMGRLAASGGYFVSMAADVIVAQPATLTGSIGVVGGKVVTAGLGDRIGIARGSVTGGDHALMFSPNRPFSDGEWERMDAMLDRIYEDFTTKVAEGRGLGRDQVDDVARGRVWTGDDAKERGLVDEHGGLEYAVEIAKDRAGIGAGAEVDLRNYPRLGPLERLRPAESSEDVAAAAARTASADGLRQAAWGRLAPVAAQLGLPAAGPLTLPGAWRIS